MRIFITTFIAAILVATACASSQSEYMGLDEMMEAGQTWMSENIDAETVADISVDPRTIRRFWRQLQQRLQGHYVVDLAKLKEDAEIILAVLAKVEGTRPYAVWLRTRMDYFQVAEELEIYIPPPSPKHPRKTRIPSAAIQRKVWREQLEDQPVPVGSRHYASQLKPVFKSVGIPPELIWLAEVESSFDPKARSPVGATGLFQFMPATARQYGLSLKPQDERLDPKKSARAAARYLRYLHGRFDSWPLALAAYNAGEGRVSKLLQHHDAETFQGIIAGLPAETQLYVPKIEATVYRREGVKLENLTIDPQP